MNDEYGAQAAAIVRRAGAVPELAGLDVAGLIQPSIRLTTTRVSQRALGLGESRIGGLPDVPPDWEWPLWAPRRPRRPSHENHPGRPSPLGFIAQIDLAATPRVDDALPASGWLLFFYDRYVEPLGFDPADRGCCRVFHVEADRARLVRAEPPDDLEAEHESFPCRVATRVEPTLLDELPDVPYDSAVFNAYCSFLDGSRDDDSTQHRLLGHSQNIQNPMELECQLASNGVDCGSPAGYESAQGRTLAAGAVNWRLLLQIDTDEDGPGWMWGDVGRIYFWVRRRDLEARRFEDVWLILQCC